MSRLIGVIAVTTLAAMGSAPLSAAPVTQCGPTICYSYDDAQGAVGLFGTPSLVGDSLVFLPPDFRAQSTDGVGVNSGTNIDTATANFIIDEVYSKNGVTEVTGLTIVEFGDYEITNGDSVSADLLLSVVNMQPGPPLFPGAPALPEFGSDQQSFDAVGDSSGLQTWQLTGYFDPAAEFVAEATSVSMTIQNTLTATTNAFGENAWIQKKITLTAAVPIPAAVWLFASGLGLLAGVRRARR